MDRQRPVTEGEIQVENGLRGTGRQCDVTLDLPPTEGAYAGAVVELRGDQPVAGFEVLEPVASVRLDRRHPGGALVGSCHHGMLAWEQTWDAAVERQQTLFEKELDPLHR